MSFHSRLGIRWCPKLTPLSSCHSSNHARVAFVAVPPAATRTRTLDRSPASGPVRLKDTILLSSWSLPPSVHMRVVKHMTTSGEPVLLWRRVSRTHMFMRASKLWCVHTRIEVSRAFEMDELLAYRPFSLRTSRLGASISCRPSTSASVAHLLLESLWRLEWCRLHSTFPPCCACQCHPEHHC